MTYKLAQQLKDAGFPFKETQDHGQDYDSVILDDGMSYLVPTLPELIKACLKQHCVFKLHCWEHGFVIGFQKEEKRDDMEICLTPEEAVANLWLVLNKK